jgi:hypothetical protein
MTTTATTPIPQVSTFQKVLQALILATTVAEAFPNPAVDAGAALAAKMEQIVLAAMTAHQTVTGMPLDPTLLHQIPLIPEAPAPAAPLPPAP